MKILKKGTQLPLKTWIQDHGITLIEVMMAMAIGGFIVLELLSLLQSLSKGTKQVKQIGDYDTMVFRIARQLTNGCGSLFPASENPKVHTSIGGQTNLTMLKETTSGGGPFTADQIRIKSDGSTFVGGVQYLMVLTTTDDACDADRSKPCRGTLTLKLDRSNPSPSPSTSSKPSFFGLSSMSQDVAHVFFTVNSSDNFTGCSYKSQAPIGEVRYDDTNCAFYPDPPHRGEPANFGGDNVPLPCAEGSVTMAACVSTWNDYQPKKEPPSAPEPDHTYTANYCNSRPGVVTATGCCGLSNRNEIKPGTSKWRINDCLAGEVVTGICSREIHPGGAPIILSDADNGKLSPKEVPVPNCTQSGGELGNVYCSPIGNMNTLSKYCRRVSLGSSIAHCNTKEIMTGFCALGSGCPGGGNYLTCCPIFP